jgi:hypothetical protein
VDTAGNVYAADEFNNRVLKLLAGSNTAPYSWVLGAQVELSFSGLNLPSVSGNLGMAVDSAGNVYVTDELNKRVLKLAAQSA